MSRLADKMKRAGRVEPAPIGFGAPPERRAAATMLCLLRLEKDEAKKVAQAAAAADAVIITGADAGKLADLLKKLGDVPAGLRLEGGKRTSVAAAREAGADFVVLDEESAADAVLEEKTGLVLTIDRDAGDTELRALAGLSLDALDVGPLGEPFTLRRLMGLRRVSLLSQTPLLVDVPAGIEASRLEALREAGVAGVVLDGRSADKLQALREAVVSLPPRGRRREGRTEALLPSVAAAASSEEDEEPEYE
jgi:hypothetical protein